MCKNGSNEFSIHYNNRQSKMFPHQLMAYVWTMKLTKGDTINLKLGPRNDLYVTSNYRIFYSGELLIEDEQ